MTGTKVSTCSATMESMAVAGHTHVCSGEHDAGDHFCSECKRWFWTVTA